MNSSIVKIIIILVLGLFLGYYAFSIGIILLKALLGLGFILAVAFGITVGYHIAKKKYYNETQNKE